MPKGPKAAAPAAAAKKGKAAPEKENSLIEKRAKNFGIGNNVQPKRDLSRFVKWPKNVRLQRQRRILYQRLRTPPMINMFTRSVDKNTATELFKMLNKYRPETREQKQERIEAAAKEQEAGGAKDQKTTKHHHVKCGINHIARLVEQKKATMVMIAHDVDPIELVIWLPTLCRKMDVPFCIVKGKARLGAVVHKKTATALAFTGVRKEDEGAMAKLVDSVRSNFNDRYDDFKKWSGGKINGAKSQERTRQKEKAVAREAAKRMIV
jgi:large subunit ribosomal protein L7Ae